MTHLTLISKMKTSLTILLASMMFAAGWIFRGAQNEKKVLATIEETAEGMGDRILDETLRSQREINAQNELQASDELSLFLLGRSSLAKEFLKRDSLESFSTFSNGILRAFITDYEEGVRYRHFQPVAEKLYAETDEIKAELSTPFAPSSLTP